MNISSEVKVVIFKSITGYKYFAQEHDLSTCDFNIDYASRSRAVVPITQLYSFALNLWFQGNTKPLNVDNDGTCNHSWK